VLRRFSKKGLGDWLEIFVYCVLDCALCVADPLLNLSLCVLRRSLRLELSVARRFADAFFNLPGRLVGKTGNFIAGATHLFHPRHERPAPLQSCNKRCIRTFRCKVRMGRGTRALMPEQTSLPVAPETAYRPWWI